MTLDPREELARAIREVARELAALQESLSFLVLLSKQLDQSENRRGAKGSVPAVRHVPTCPMPAPEIVRTAIRNRRLRAEFLSATAFGEPAWDILLELFLAALENRETSITSLCQASGIPVTTALRWIKALEAAGLVGSIDDPNDRRRRMVALTQSGGEAIARYFYAIGGEPVIDA
jgi:DNA-binding MarR family transcriptional regulator